MTYLRLQTYLFIPAAVAAALVGGASRAGAADPVIYNGTCPALVAVIDDPNPLNPQVWACGGPIGVGVGATANNGPTRVCILNIPVQVNSPVGVYVMEQDSGGYAGVSNYETGSGNEDCNQSNNGNSSNSGGSLGLAVGPGLEVPAPLACGAASGRQFGSTGRDGCYVFVGPT